MTSATGLLERIPDLIDELREAGYPIGVEQYIAAEGLLLELAARQVLPDDPWRLCTLLGPVFCKSDQEQDDFPARFYRWIERNRASAGPAAPGDLERALNVAQRGAWVLRAGLATASVAALVIAASALLNPTTNARPAPSSLAKKAELADGASKKPDVDVPSPPVPTVNAPSGPAGTGQAASEGNKPETSQIDRERVSVGYRDASEPDKPGVSASGSSAGVDSRAVKPPPTPVRPLQGDTRRTTLLLSMMTLVVAGYVSWRLWWAYRARLFLVRRSTSELPDLTTLSTQGTGVELYRGLAVDRLARQLRQRRPISSNRLDVRATVLSTIRNGGWFTPVSGRSLAVPEYLILIDRAGHDDHQSQLFDALIERLAREEVIVVRYEFDGDPRMCHAAGTVTDIATIRDLAARYTEHQLLVFSTGDGLINPLTGDPAAWAEQFAHWPERTILTPEGIDHWSHRESTLARLGFLVLPATEDGLACLADPSESPLPEAEALAGYSAPFPEMLRERPRRWLEERAPDAETLEELLVSLRWYLGAQGFEWLAACAVYPAIHWALTLELGYNLRTGDGHRLLDERRLAALARLPWLRHGMMPNWLRLALIRSLSRDRERTVRAALQALFLTASEGDSKGLGVEIALARRNVLAPLARQIVRTLRRRVADDSPLRDYIFASYLSGRTPSPLAFELPGPLAGLIDGRAGWTGPVALAILVLALVGSLVSVNLSRSPEPKTIRPTGAARPTEVAAVKSPPQEPVGTPTPPTTKDSGSAQVAAVKSPSQEPVGAPTPPSTKDSGSTQVVAVKSPSQQSVGTHTADDAPRPTNAPTRVIFGQSYCAVCHGSRNLYRSEELVCRMNEWSVWNSEDKHKLAYDLLSGERAKMIGKKLGIDVTSHQACLSCHSVVIGEFPQRQLPQFERSLFVQFDRKSDGVSCVACHGAYREWILDHQLFKDPRWRFLSRSERERRMGMVDLWNPVTRTRICVSCHVGNHSEGKILTHAMYASGHPRLPGIEIATFSEAMPRHWEYLGEKRRGRLSKVVQAVQGNLDLDKLEQTELVAVSGLVLLAESLKLFAAEAESNQTRDALGSKWPDLARYDCASCHDGLRSPSWRSQRGFSGASPRVPTWPLALVDVAVRAIDPTRASERLDDYERRIFAFSSALRAQPYGNRVQAISAARGLAAWADAVLVEVSRAKIDHTVALRMLDGICKRAQAEILDYDSARQLYWAFRTIYAEVARERRLTTAIPRTLEELDRQLGFGLPSAGIQEPIEKTLFQRLQAVTRYDPNVFQTRFAELARELSVEKGIR